MESDMVETLEVISSLPSEIVTLDQDIIATYVTDFRQLYTGTSKVLLRPRSVADVQQIVRLCGEAGVPLVPQGGNTSYCTAATPSRQGRDIIVSLERMNAIRELDAGNLSICVDAGAVLSDVQSAADEAGLQFPLALGSQQSCRIGGNLSTNAGGVAVVRNGMARDLVLGLEVVLADGSLLSDLAPLRKNNAGYDVKQLFIGAEGTLGIITGASLRLARKPRQTMTAFLAISELSALPDLLAAAQEYSGEMVSSFEYISHTSLNLLLTAKLGMRHPLAEPADHYVLLEVSSASPVLLIEDAVTTFLGDMMERGLVLDGSIAAAGRQRNDFWELRESIPEAEVFFGGSVKHDVAVRTSAIPDFIARAGSFVKSVDPGAVLSIYGHVGDGNVHFNVLAPSKALAKAFKDRVDAEISPGIYDIVDRMGGTFSAEYGIGRTKLALLQRYGDPGKIALMRRLKDALDPSGIFNPGKVVPEG